MEDGRQGSARRRVPVQLSLRVPGKEIGVNDYNRLSQRRDREYKVPPLKRARVPAAVVAALPVEKPISQADIDRVLAELHDRRSRELTEIPRQADESLAQAGRLPGAGGENQ